jgi:hypothetical protein
MHVLRIRPEGLNVLGRGITRPPIDIQGNPVRHKQVRIKGFVRQGSPGIDDGLATCTDLSEDEAQHIERSHRVWRDSDGSLRPRPRGREIPRLASQVRAPN